MQLTDLYNPIIGGVQSYVAALSKGLVGLGHTAVVVTIQPGDLPEEETIDGVRVIRIRSWSQHLTRFYSDTSHPFHPPAPDPGAVAALRRLIRREQPAVVHSHSWLNHSFFPLYHAHSGPGHVVTLHDYGTACPRTTLMRPGHAGQCSGPGIARCLSCAPEQYGLLKGSMITLAMRADRCLQHRVDRYLAVSAAAADGCRGSLPAGAEITTHPPMVPDDLLQVALETPRPDFLPAEDGFLLFVGALGLHKGIDVLLAARRRMRHQVALVLLGTPQHDTPSVDDPSITVAHNVPHPQVMASWMRASIAVVPSVCNETLGLVAVEAAIAGCPVVASDVGGLGEVVEHGSNGLLVPPGDPDALAAALDDILDDPELRKLMGEASRARTRQYGVRNVVPGIVEVYEDALRGRLKKSGAEWRSGVE
ncbi:MAG: glycosyltransferase family 4 protein [Trebonia sp.]|jgi:glycosyltransferase involved in cell wall biosynthesis